VLACALVVASLPARAQTAGSEEPAAVQQEAHESVTPASEAPREALDHYLKGRRWYLAGRYRDALVELKAALEFDRDSADLLYNVARVYENLGELDSAIEYYSRYLTKLPVEATEERDKTQKTIRRLAGARRELAARTPPPAAAPEASRARGRADLAFWVTTGAGVALLGGGAACGLLALHKTTQVDKFVAGPDGSLAQRQHLGKDAKRFALIADGLFIAGGVALTSAALLFLLRDGAETPAKSAPRVGFSVDGQRALLDVSGSF
jgi:tetratricopeptide (TPR) repeat protein